MEVAGLTVIDLDQGSGWGSQRGSDSDGFVLECEVLGASADWSSQGNRHHCFLRQGRNYLGAGEPLLSDTEWLLYTTH